MTRAQAAIEYLTTYAWAFVVLLIMVGAIVYMGILDPPVPEKCIMAAGIECSEMAISADDEKIFAVFRNKLGYPIVLNGIVAVSQGLSCDGAALTYAVVEDPIPLDETWKENDIRTVEMDCFGLGENQAAEIDITLNYRRAGGSINQTHVGTITGKSK